MNSDEGADDEKDSEDNGVTMRMSMGMGGGGPPPAIQKMMEMAMRDMMMGGMGGGPPRGMGGMGGRMSMGGTIRVTRTTD